MFEQIIKHTGGEYIVAKYRGTMSKQKNYFDRWRCSTQPQQLSVIGVPTSRNWNVCLSTALSLVGNFRELCVIWNLILHMERNSSRDLLNGLQLSQKVLSGSDQQLSLV